jgi:hypothetical protein
MRDMALKLLNAGEVALLIHMIERQSEACACCDRNRRTKCLQHSIIEYATRIAFA